MFKGPGQAMEAIFTAPTSAMCGVTLEADSKEYLITGRTTVPITPFVTAKALKWHQHLLSSIPVPGTNLYRFWYIIYKPSYTPGDIFLWSVIYRKDGV